MGPRSLWIAVTAALVFGVLILLAYQRSPPEPGAERREQPEERVRESEAPATPARRHVAGSHAPPGKRNVTKVSAEQRAQLEAAIKEVRAALAQPTVPLRAASNEQPRHTRENIREQVAEAVPLLAECYELQRERTPDVGGTLQVRFTIDAALYARDQPVARVQANAAALRAAELAIYIDAAGDDALHAHDGAEFLHRVSWELDVAHEYHLRRDADHSGPDSLPRLYEAFAWVAAHLQPSAAGVQRDLPLDEPCTRSAKRQRPTTPRSRAATAACNEISSPTPAGATGGPAWDSSARRAAGRSSA